MSPPRLVLASGSPRRSRLLEEWGYRFEVLPADVDEIVDPAEPPEANAERLAREKAEAVVERVEDAVVLAADTLVAVEGEILGKPRDADHAHEILARLSGTRHRVISGVCAIATADRRRVCGWAATTLQMAELTGEFIRDYVASGRADGKAGAYAYQEGGDRFLTIESGAVDTVVGLPRELVDRYLAELGIAIA